MKTNTIKKFKKGFTGLEFLLAHAVISCFLIASVEIATDGGISKLSDTKKIEVVKQKGSIKE